MDNDNDSLDLFAEPPADPRRKSGGNQVGSTAGSGAMRTFEPLARRMRPRNFDEFVGQQEAVGRGHFLRRMIEMDQIPSIIFYGPPGTGKTTLAQMIAAMTDSAFE